MQILLIEDDVRLQRATRGMLERRFPAATVTVVGDAQAALEELRRAKPDAIVSDYDLGPLSENGAHVLAWLRIYEPELVPRFTFFCGQDREKMLKLHDRVAEKPEYAALVELLRPLAQMQAAAEPERGELVAAGAGA